jgi:hypothetical protein
MKVLLKISFIVLVLALTVFGSALPSYAADDRTLTGKVVESMDSGGYTYVQIENSGKKTWVAVPKTKVVVGQDITLSPGNEMKNFESKTLKRKFDSIIFSGGVIGQGEKGIEKKSPGSHGSAVVVTEKIKVDKASGPDAYTVAEIFERGKELEGKKVVVRGKAVKVSEGIMNKNWIHLQDGSGDAKTKNNDLVLTSKDLANVGDVVTATGTLYINKDFGGGYKYSAIIENTVITKEESTPKKEDTGKTKEDAGAKKEDTTNKK